MAPILGSLVSAAAVLVSGVSGYNVHRYGAMIDAATTGNEVSGFNSKYHRSEASLGDLTI